MPQKPPSGILIAPGTAEQTQSRQLVSRSDVSESHRPQELTARIRTSHACDRCRTLRAKCSGGARCVKCTKDNARCQYSDRKRELYKKSLGQGFQDLEHAQEEKRKLVATLRDLIENADFTSERVSNALSLLEEMSEDPQTESPVSVIGSQAQIHGQGQKQGQCEEEKPFEQLESLRRSPALSSGGESLVMADIGSPSRQRELGRVVGLEYGHGMAGYVGKMSGMSWLRRANEYLVDRTPITLPDTASTVMDIHIMKATSLTYFMDDQDLLGINEDYVDPHELPTWPSAQILSEAYFHCSQGAFRFVQRERFLKELHQTFHAAASPGFPISWYQRRFLALANMMWSVGAKWLEIARLDTTDIPQFGQMPISEGHLVYYARARALGLDHRMQLDHPDVQMVQGLGVLALYLMVNGSIQRAWSLVGQAIRHANALGLHLKVLTEALPDVDHEGRARLWHSLFRLEILLSEMTGRPKGIRFTDASVPFDFQEQQTKQDESDTSVSIGHSTERIESHALWTAFLGRNQVVAQNLSGGNVSVGFNITEKQFIAGIRLSAISDKIGTKLYLSSEDLTWADVQATTGMLQSELDKWHDALYPELKLETIGDASVDNRSRLELEMYYCSIKMILYRPCLCEIRIPGESKASADFNRLSARACVQTAIRLIGLMPEDPIANEIFQVFPWWSLLHYICQSAAILLLELCMNVQHMQHEVSEVMSAMRKTIQCLWLLAPTSKSAYKAWATVRLLAQKVTQRYPHNVLMHLPEVTSKPSGWNDDDEGMLKLTMMSMMQ